MSARNGFSRTVSSPIDIREIVRVSRNLLEIAMQIYKHLDARWQEIRVLVVAAGHETSPVQCTLLHAFLSDERDIRPAYETVSYVWGDPSARSLIYIDGHERDVPASSERVLRRMRWPDRQRVLWIDAVCINQSDTAERSSQVAMMAEIYSQAEGNLIWFGDDDGFSLRAFVCIQGLDLDALEVFFASPWFHRRWVIQEATLAVRNTVFRGDFQLPLEDVLRVATWIICDRRGPQQIWASFGLLNATRLQHYVDSQYTWRWGSPETSQLPFRLPLRSLLEDVRHFSAKDPRDCVYSVVALYMRFNPHLQTIPELINPDYSLPLSAVLAKATELSIKEDSNLLVLSKVRQRHSDQDEREIFSSWAPRWDLNHDPQKDAWYLNETFNACADLEFSMPTFQTAHSPYTLEVSGYRLGSIRMRTATFQASSFDSLEAFEPLHSMAKYIKGLALAATTEGVLSQTLCAGAANAFSYIAFRKYIEQNARLPPWPHELNDRSASAATAPSDYRQAMYNACKLRCVFVTDSGYFGIGPQTMDEGDCLAIFAGCSMPVVVRRIGGGEHQYTFVGASYVYYIMSGEAVGHSQRDGRDVESFVLI